MLRLESFHLRWKCGGEGSFISGRDLLIVGHPTHVVIRGVAAKRCHGPVIGGDKVADDDSHGSSAKEFSGRIVVSGGNFQEISCAEFVATTIEEQDGGHAEKFAIVVDFGVESRYGFFAREVFEDELFCVIVHVAANAEKYAIVFHSDRAGLFAVAWGQIIAGVATGLHVHPSWIDAF